MAEITMPMGRYLREHQTLKYFFFGGKGGVGKTVFAGAAAIGLARQGRRTLLVSTNPVHSLTSLFGQDMLGKHVPVEGVPNLWGCEIDTRQSIERSKVEIREKIRWFLKFADITTKADDFVESATMNPAFEESAMFENMVDLMFKNEYDVYVFDTAPTANARRLLGMSKVYSLWVNKRLKSREEARTLREMLSFTKKKEADPLMEYLVSFRDRMERARVLHAVTEGDEVGHQRVHLLLLGEGEQLPQAPRLLAALEHLIDPQRVDLGHPEQAPGVGGGGGVEDVDVVFVLEHEVYHVLEHRRLFERGVHRRRLDEVISLGGDVRELEEPADLLANLQLAALDALPGVNLAAPEIGHAFDGDMLTEHILAEQAGQAVHGIGVQMVSASCMD